MTIRYKYDALNDPCAASNTLTKWAWWVHCLYAASFIAGITLPIGVIIAYAQHNRARGTLLESHFIYAIRTFWIGLALLFIIGALCFFFIGLLAAPLLLLWWLIRIIRPIVALACFEPIDDPYRFF